MKVVTTVIKPGVPARVIPAEPAIVEKQFVFTLEEAVYMKQLLGGMSMYDAKQAHHPQWSGDQIESMHMSIFNSLNINITKSDIYDIKKINNPQK